MEFVKHVTSADKLINLFTFENMDKGMWKYQILKEEEKLKIAELKSILELPKYADFVRKHEILWKKKRKDFNELEKECIGRKYRELNM